jgi:hypothetical protein
VKEDRTDRACSLAGEKTNGYRFLVGNPEGKRTLEDLDIGGRIILQRMSVKQDGVVRTGFIWLRIGTTGWLL